MNRMMLSTSRLKALVKRLDFSLFYSDSRTKEIAFVRSSREVRLYEHLLISGQGKMGEAVCAKTSVSAARFFPAYGSVAIEDNDLLVALETDAERHWTLLASTEDARNWERRLAEVAGSFASKTTEKYGESLLVSLRSALEACDGYVEKIGDIHAIFDREHGYCAENARHVISEGERLAFGSSLQNWAYDDVNLACLILAKFGSEVEGVPDPWRNVVPLNSHDVLMPRIVLLADFIHGCRLAYQRASRANG